MHHSNYHPWLRLALMAEDIGDTIGSNDAGTANQAYALASRIRELMSEHPWKLSRPWTQHNEEPPPLDERGRLS